MANGRFVTSLSHSPTSIKEIIESLSIIRASNDLLFAEDGREYIDLFAGCGTVLLGHVNPAVTAAIYNQLNDVWITGALQNSPRAQATPLVESFFPSSHYLAALYSTGMEAVEFALRVARVVTGRKGVVSFDGCMHGKSTATAYLGWPNNLVTLPDFRRLPYVSRAPEDKILELLAETLATESVSAVLIEPLQGSSGGHLASPQFFQSMTRLCGEHGSLLVVDEIFTGFYRTGEAFLHEELGIAPDIVLIGKAMGNGFPVSGVVVDRKYSINGAMLPCSTFAGNALAASAVAATLSQMKEMDLRSRVAEIDQTVRESLSALRNIGVTIRGKGALWILEVPPHLIDDAVVRIFHDGVVVSVAGSYMRLLPPATILSGHLAQACAVVREAILRSYRDHSSRTA